jgi:TP901 family phage tail tape measure protein
MAQTEPLVFKIEARTFISSLTRMGNSLEKLGTQAETAARQLEGAFRPIERRAVAVADAIKKAGEGVEPVAESYRKLGLAFSKLNRELDEDKALAVAGALETLNLAVKETGSLQRFAEKMNKLKGVLKQVKTDAEKTAAAVTALVKAADKEIGVQRQRRQTPEQAKRDRILTQKAEIKLQEALAKQTERTARAAERANKRIGRSARQASDESVGAYKRIERSVAGLRVRLLNLRTAFGFIGGGFLAKSVIGFAADFEDELARVNTIIQDQSEVQLPKYKEQLLGLSKEGPQDLIDLTQGLYQIISAGIPTIEGAGGAFDVLAASQKAAVAGISTLKEAADATVTVLNGFRKESLSSTEATDKLFATVRLGRTRFDLLARSVGRVAAVADEFGASSDEILGGLASITRVIPSTNEAVTQLRALITGIVRPTQNATEVLAQLTAKQPQLKDLLSAGGLQRRGLVDTLRQLTAVTGGSADAITKLFPNVRALAAAAILGGSNFKEFERIVAGVADSAGETDKAFKKMRFTFNNVAAVFRNKVATILVKIGDQIMPKLVELFERLGAFLIKNQDKIAKFFVLIADALIAIVNLAQQFSNEILGALAGGLTGKIVSYLAGLVPAISKFLGKKAETIGETTRQSFIESLLVPGGAALGALAGESIFGLRTDVDGQVSLDKRQPLVADDLALEQGFRTAGLFQEAFTSARQGQGLFIDTPIRVDEVVLGDLKRQLNLSEEIDKAETFNDVFALLGF